VKWAVNQFKSIYFIGADAHERHAANVTTAKKMAGLTEDASSSPWIAGT